MVLKLEDPETDRLARALADATGENLEAAVKTAIEQRLTQECSAKRGRKLEAAREIVDRVAKMPRKCPDKSARELVEDLYDENGLPK